MLDVGPVGSIRQVNDKLTAIDNESTSSGGGAATMRKAMAIADAQVKATGQPKNWQVYYDKSLTDLKAKAIANYSPEPDSTHKMLNALPENSLLIVSHGARSGGLYSESGHKFTLHNIAQVLGQDTNSINTVINAACYGGRCEPKDYQASFPNVNDVRYGNTNMSNTISVPGLEKGEYFGTGVIPNYWQNIGGNWIQESGPTP